MNFISLILKILINSKGPVSEFMNPDPDPGGKLITGTGTDPQDPNPQRGLLVMLSNVHGTVGTVLRYSRL